MVMRIDGKEEKEGNKGKKNIWKVVEVDRRMLAWLEKWSGWDEKVKVGGRRKGVIRGKRNGRSKFRVIFFVFLSLFTSFFFFYVCYSPPPDSVITHTSLSFFVSFHLLSFRSSPS